MSEEKAAKVPTLHPPLNDDQFLELLNHFADAMKEVVGAMRQKRSVPGYLPRYAHIPRVTRSAGTAFPYVSTYYPGSHLDPFSEDATKGPPIDHVAFVRGTGLLGLNVDFADEAAWPAVAGLRKYCERTPRISAFMTSEWKGEFSPFYIHRMVAHAADRYLHLHGTGEYDDEVAFGVIFPIARALGKVNEFGVDILVPISGVSFDLRRHRIDNATLLLPITDRLATTFYGIYHSSKTIPDRIHSMASHCAVFRGWHFGRFETYEDFRSTISNADGYPASHIEKFFSALRMVSGADVGYASQYYRAYRWAFEYRYTLPPMYGTVVRRFPFVLEGRAYAECPAIDRDTVIEASALYGKIKDRNEPSVSLAVRRLNRCLSRDDDEDALVDAVIGLEALIGDAQPGDITYKLAVRASALLARQGEDWETVFSLVKTVYAARSRIVHGTHSKRAKKELATSRADRSDTTAQAVGLLQKVLRFLCENPEFLNTNKIDRELLYVRG